MIYDNSGDNDCDDGDDGDDGDDVDDVDDYDDGDDGDDCDDDDCTLKEQWQLCEVSSHRECATLRPADLESVHYGGDGDEDDDSGDDEEEVDEGVPH